MRQEEQNWWERLRAPFPAEIVGAKPRVSCRACRDAQGKVCSKHRASKCPRCKQWITEAHVDLDYVGHADITDRLIEVDPEWTWEPAYRNVDQEQMLAAIATGNPDVVQAVVDNSPPLADANGGLWIKLTVHHTGEDGERTSTTRLGYGDAPGKGGGDAVKEVIGDGLRNAGMRFGIALDLWSKADRKADQAGEQPSNGRLRRAQSQEQGNGQRPADPEPPHAAEDRAAPDEQQPRVSPIAQGLANLAPNVKTVDELKTKVYDQAQLRKLLSEQVAHPRGGDPVPLHKVIDEFKAELQAKGEGNDG